MNKNWVLIVSVLFLVIPLFLWADQETSMKDIIAGFKAAVDLAEDSLDQEVVFLQADLIGTNTASFTYTLHKGWTYGFAVFGDWRIDEIGVEVYKEANDEWVEFRSGKRSAGYASVDGMEVKKNVECLFEIKVYEFAEDYDIGHYGAILFHEHP